MNDRPFFTPKSFWALCKMTTEERLDYHYKLKDYQIENGFYLPHIRVRKILHPFLLLLVKISRVLNRHRLICMGQSIPRQTKPFILVFTHICKWDLERVAEAVKIHFCLLAGDPEYTYGYFPDQWLMRLNGVLFMNQDDQHDKNTTLHMAIELLKYKRCNLLWAPEGTWNISPNILVYKCHKGPAVAALLGNADILPIAVGQYGEKFVVNVGKTISVNDGVCPKRKRLNSDVEKLTEQIREALATLQWEILEMEAPPRFNGEDSDAWQREIQRRFNEWKDRWGNTIYSKELIERRRCKK